MTGRILTLRGQHEFAARGSHEEVLLTNASPDRTRAWKVIDARIWTLWNGSNATPVHKTGSEYVISLRLQTDTMRRNEELPAEDNRAFGWLRSLYRVSQGLGSVVAGEWNSMEVIDPQHIISDQLYGCISYSPDSVGENSPSTVCWMITLEQVKIRPMEAILQTIKGRAQDVGV